MGPYNWHHMWERNIIPLPSFADGRSLPSPRPYIWLKQPTKERNIILKKNERKGKRVVKFEYIYIYIKGRRAR